MAKRTIEKEKLQAQLSLNPDATLKELAAHFKCGIHTLARELKSNGLSTKPRHLRPLSEEGRRKISDSAKRRVGELNPNYGEKSRPWLEGDNHPLKVWHRSNPDFGEKQRGDSNPIHSVKHLYDDPEYVTSITRGLRDHVQAKTGKTYEEIYGEKAAREYKDKLRAASPGRLQKFLRKTTKPELLMRGILTGLGVDFVEQHPIGYHTVDFFVPSKRLVVQVDGDYWHGNPQVYPEEKLSGNQRKQKRLDKACDTYCRNQGLTLMRVWEADLVDAPQVEDRIKEALK